MCARSANTLKENVFCDACHFSCRGVRMLATGSFAHYARVLRESYMKGIPQLSLAHAGSEAIMGLNLGI